MSISAGWGRVVALAVVAATLSSTSSAPAGAAPGSRVAPAGAAAPPEGAVFVPVQPCRVADTREGGGPLSTNETRAFQVSGSGAAFAAQGGTSGGCAIPDTSVAVSASVTAVSPRGDGFFRAWPSGGPAATATFLSFTKNQGTTNTGAIGLGAGTKDLTTKNFKAVADYVIDVQGHFVAAADLPVGVIGSVFVPTLPCRVADTREGGGVLSSGEQRSFQVAGSGAGFAAQGGKANGCTIPDAATGVSASVTAVSPRGDGFFRAWPSGGPAATATFVNFTKNQGTTNTGAFGLGTGTKDLTTKNFKSASDYVIDVGGYFIAPADLPTGVVGSVFVPARPCRVADTREGGGAVSTNEQRSFQVAGSGAGFAAQGGKANGCAVLDAATAVEASVTAVAPKGDGFFRAWPSGGPAATATFLNFTKDQGTTNTGSLGLGTGTKDLTTKNYKATTDYVIDVQGYFRIPPTAPEAPTFSAVAPGDGQVTLTWATPVSDGGSPITGYVVTTLVDGVAQSANTFPSAATTQTITGLTNNSTYAFEVAATNSVGTGPQSEQSDTATPATPFTADTIDVAGGGRHTCALLADGTIKCWGNNSSGQLGIGSATTDVHTPVTVSAITTAAAIVAGYYHSCALLDGGSVQCWGNNENGQLGNGTVANSTTPVAVSGITTATAITAGFYQTCALLADGSVQCWGANFYGQLGNGTLVGATSPVAVSGISTVTAITAGDLHSCAVLAGGSMSCWGYNGQGQLGNGTNVGATSPVAVSGISTAVAVTAGSNQTCGLLADGSVPCWGKNSGGELGNGTLVSTNVPVTIPGLAATAISGGSKHACARRADGSIQCWGQNNRGQLGDGTTLDRRSPVTVLGLTAVDIATGARHSCALRADASIECWGQNSTGELGNGSITDALTPVPVWGTT